MIKLLVLPTVFLAAVVVSAQEPQGRGSIVQEDLINNAVVEIEGVQASAIAQEKKKNDYPKFKQSGSVSFNPRLEVLSRTDANGTDLEYIPVHRRLMFAWAYRLNIAVNERLDIYFRLSDPQAESGNTEIWGPGSGRNFSDFLKITLPNAYFTWKPIEIFNFSAGLLNVIANTALNLDAAWTTKNPTRNFSNEYGNSLAGISVSFPVSSALKIFTTAGITDNTYANIYQYSETDTVAPYSSARVVLGADLSLADSKISVKPAVNIRTRGDKITGNAATDSTDDSRRLSNPDEKPIVSGGIDGGFKIAAPLSFNANVGLLNDNQNEAKSF